MKTIIQQVRGTREFYPHELAVRQWLYSLIGEVSSSFGYEEYDGPFLEKIDLYAAKSGEELVKEQAFVFPDRSGELITLRPELTPSLARMVAKKQNELVYPLRWWSFGPFWRYEKPQKGRTREFFQWNIDMIGVNSPEADAEMVAICASFLKKAGIRPDQVSIFINHRKLVSSLLEELGIKPDLNKKVFQLIDKLDKLSASDWENSGKEIGLISNQLSSLKKVLADDSVWEKSPELVRVFKSLENFGLLEYVKFDPRIVRGLDYYTGTVFEAWDVEGDGRAVLGGGHYDNLVGDVGGEPLPGVGFAMGDVMISLLLEKYGKIPSFDFYSKTILVTVFSEELLSASQIIASRLRETGLTVICYPDVVKLQKQLKFADRLGIGIAVVIGPDEAAVNNITIKNLSQRTQVTCPDELAASAIKEMLASPKGV